MLFSGYHLGINLVQASLFNLNLDRKSLVKEGGLFIEEEDLRKDSNTHSRNCIFRIHVSGKIYLVKQPRTDDLRAQKSLKKEILIYKLLGGNSHFRKHIPEMAASDEVFHLVFLENLPRKSSVIHRYDLSEVSPNDGEFKPFLSELGATLAILHSFKECPHELRPQFAFGPPLILQFTKKDLYDLKEYIGPDSTQGKIAELLLDETISAVVYHHSLWETNALIHYDLKFDHFFQDPADRIIKIVDWEMADFGDLNFDLASVLFALFNQLFIHEDSHEDRLTYSLNYFNAFLQGYTNPYNKKKILIYFAIQLLTKLYHGQVQVYLDPRIVPRRVIDDLISFAKCVLTHPEPWMEKLVTVKKGHSEILPLSYRKEPFKGKLSGHEYGFDQLIDIILCKYGLNEPGESGKPPGVESSTGLPDKDILKEDIYQWYWGKYDIGPEDISSVEIANKPDPTKAERYHDKWWRVNERTLNGHVMIRKNSEKRYEEPGQFYMVSDSRTNFLTPRKDFNDDAHVNLSFSKYSVTRNSAVESKWDLWVTSKTKIRQDFPNWVRFYFSLNANLDGIYFFIEEVKKLFDERGISFEIKVRNNLERYCRADSAILFIHRQHYFMAIIPIRNIYEKLKAKQYLREVHPKMTKELLPGLSFAENPVVPDDSFGNIRAEIIANAIINKWGESKIVIKEGIYKAFEEKGYNTYELYRNPFLGKKEFKFRFDLFNRGIESSIYENLNYLKLNRKQYFLDVAREIAFLICREAIWYGDYCNWLSYKGDEGKTGFWLLTEEEKEKSGVGQFLAGMYKLCPGESIFSFVAKACYPEQEDSLDGKSIYDVYREYFRGEKRAFNVSEIGYLYQLIRQEVHIQFPELVAQELVNKYFSEGIPLPNAYAKDWNDGKNGTEICFTRTHGLAAIGYFFMDLAARAARIVLYPSS